MGKQNIANCLKQLRRTSAYSASEIVEMLKEYDINISAKTLYGYESGLSMPNADVFVALCRIYKCDNPMDIFGGISLSSSEITLIEKYRSLDPFGQETVNIAIGRESGRSEQITALEDRITIMTAEPADDIHTRIYPYLRKIVAAGVGFYFDDIPTDTIEAPYRENADFIIGVSGDSMEPTYYDGDLIYVQKLQTIEPGDIGIFIVDGECFIKEAGNNGLISHNSKYNIIPGNKRINCIGKVLGKVNML